MKKTLLFLIIASMMWVLPLYAADTKITELTEDTAPTSDDLVPTVNAPGTSPANRKATLANLFKWALVPGGSTNVTTITGNYAFGITLTDTTNVTFPTSGTLATTAGTLANTVLDDTKGNGDTAFVWSADKVYDQLALKQNADADLTTWAGITPSANLQTFLSTPNAANFETAIGAGAFASDLLGYANAAAVLSGIGAQASDADLTAIAALSCSQNQIVKRGASAWECGADNDSAGTPAAITVADTTDTTSYVALFESATGDLGPKTDAGITYNANTGMLSVTGLTAGTGGITASKQSGVAGDMGLYEANSTDTHAAGFRGPASITGDGAYRILFPNARASSANMVLAVTNGSESGTGTAADPYIQTGSWADLDNYAPAVLTGYSKGAGTVAATDTILQAIQKLDGNDDAKAPLANPQFTGVVDIPANATTDAEGEITIDTTSNQFRYYGGAQRVLSPIQHSSFVITAPAATDDINIMKAPYGMTITGINCIVQGTTSVTGQLQECNSTGGSCADLDSDITCDADGAADDGSLTDSTIASGAWLRWKTTSVSGTPTFLTVTFKYLVVAD